MPRVVETHGADETAALGAELAAGLAPGDVVLLTGEVGTGKTTLVRGACRALGVVGPITSPTFAIGNRYSAANGVVVAHLDLYRIASLAHEDPDLLDDYLGPDRIAFVEWPNGRHADLGRVRARVAITHVGEDRRRIELS